MTTRSGAGSHVTPLLRRSRLAALAVGGFLLPWCVLLAVTLPATAHVQNWSLAWTGLDAAEAIAALSTAVLLARADVRAALTASAGGALLLADAWFDVCTSVPGLDHAMAAAEAALVEVPLAAAAFWLAARLTRLGVGSQEALRTQPTTLRPLDAPRPEEAPASQEADAVPASAVAGRARAA